CPSPSACARATDGPSTSLARTTSPVTWCASRATTAPPSAAPASSRATGALRLAAQRKALAGRDRRPVQNPGRHRHTVRREPTVRVAAPVEHEQRIGIAGDRVEGDHDLAPGDGPTRLVDHLEADRRGP